MVEYCFFELHPLGEQIHQPPKEQGHMKILHYKTAKSHHDFTSRAGLMAPATLLERLGLGKIIDRMMPAPGSNRGYRHGIVFETFMLMFHEDAQCLEDMRHLRKEQELVKLMGFRSLPCAATLGNWLHRVGRHKPSWDARRQSTTISRRRPRRPGTARGNTVDSTELQTALISPS